VTLSAIVRIRFIGAVNFQISGCLYLSMPMIAANMPPLGAKMYTDPILEPVNVAQALVSSANRRLKQLIAFLYVSIE